MSTPQSSLFRQEALAAQSDSSAGAPIHIRPVGAGWLTLFFAVLCAAVLLLLVLGSYTRKERVQGVVQARGGVAALVVPDAAVVRQVRVAEGQRVKAGDVIAELGQERFSDEGNTGSLVDANLASQRDSLQAQQSHRAEAQRAERAAQAQRAAQARRDLAALDEEARLLARQIESSQRVLQQLTPLLDERIVSGLQVEQQRQTVLEQEARRQALKRQRSAAEAALAQARDDEQRLQAQHEAEGAGLKRELLSLQQAQVQQRGQHVMVLRAPKDGIVSGLMALPGQALPAGHTLASVVPEPSAMDAVLYVPSTAIGFIREGQAVRVSYDAFPYQRFGQYAGTVHSVSRNEVRPAQPDAQDRRAYFLVRVTLERPSVEAYGTEIALKPGQTLSADIAIDRRRLIRWMLDPLYAFTGRL
ncbi:HlyD family efflux transporter periplasmic adaptor subunit [Aquabacterium sp. A3]|uniref:HlyD family secretion protein n=1 Tax=Aquabacterium sp. A3 TaxID=3132829 RepID=UPI00311A4A8F